MKLSTTVTAKPRSSSAGTSIDPRYPAPPVTRTFVIRRQSAPFSDGDEGRSSSARDVARMIADEEAALVRGRGVVDVADDVVVEELDRRVLPESSRR